MTAARRLLLALGAGGGFAAPPLPIVLTVTGEGGYNGQSDYKAAYYNGRTYFGWVNADGDVKVATFVEATNTVEDEFTLHAALQADLHVSPSILVRDSDKRLVVAYTKSGEDVFYVRISTNPEDTSAWGSEVDLHSTLGGTNYTYPEMFQMLGRTGDPIYIFYRDQPTFPGASLAYTYTTDHDASPTWAAQTVIWTLPGKTSYWKVYGDGDNRIDVAAIDGHPATQAPTKLYHMWNDGPDWHATDGTVTGLSFPMDTDDMTEVYSGSESAWIHNMSIDADGHPVILYWTGTFASGNMDVNYAHWDGAAWESNLVTAMGGPAEIIYAPGGAILDETDPTIAYSALYVDGLWQMYKFVTADDGATWTRSLLVRPGDTNALYPAIVRNRTSTSLRVLWLRGTIEGSIFTTAEYDVSIEASR